MIRDWERAKHRPRDPYPELYCRAFGIAEGDLFGSERADESGETVLRREFFGASMAAAGLAIAPPQVTHLRAGRRIGHNVIDQLRQRTSRLRHLDDFLGGADTYSVYNAELSATVALANRAVYTERVGQALRSVIAEQAQQAGWAAFDAGRLNASGLFKTGLEAARESGDTALIGNSLALIAYQEVSAGRSGVREAVVSCDAVGADGPPTVRALLYERAAWSYAHAGMVRETEQALA